MKARERRVRSGETASESRGTAWKAKTKGLGKRGAVQTKEN